MPTSHFPRDSQQKPWIVGATVLFIIWLTECTLMFVLPNIVPANQPYWLGALADAILLSLIISPILWWTAVRPLYQLSKLRARFVERLFESIEQERKQISHELHDGVGQSLTMVISGLRNLQNVADLQSAKRRSIELGEITERALEEIKQIARGLRPSLLDDLGLAAAMEHVVNEVKKHHPISIEFTTNLNELTRFPPKVETALFRIFQESVQNILRHSKASHARITLQYESGVAILEVSDDGCGIANSELDFGNVKSIQLGLQSMQERATFLGGTCRIHSTPASGTQILIRIPITQANSRPNVG